MLPGAHALFIYSLIHFCRDMHWHRNTLVTMNGSEHSLKVVVSFQTQRECRMCVVFCSQAGKGSGLRLKMLSVCCSVINLCKPLTSKPFSRTVWPATAHITLIKTLSPASDNLHNYPVFYLFLPDWTPPATTITVFLFQHINDNIEWNLICILPAVLVFR